MGEQWFAAQIKPSFQDIAMRSTEEFKPFSPTVTVVLPYRTRSGNRRRGGLTREQALCPGYLFYKFDIKSAYQGWRRINGAIGVVKLLPRWSEFPHPVNGDFVDDLYDKSKNGALTYEQALEAAIRYMPGDMVRIIEGLFEGEEGSVLSRYRTDGQLFIALLIRGTVVKTPAQYVEPVAILASSEGRRRAVAT